MSGSEEGFRLDDLQLDPNDDYAREGAALARALVADRLVGYQLQTHSVQTDSVSNALRRVLNGLRSPSREVGRDRALLLASLLLSLANTAVSLAAMDDGEAPSADAAGHKIDVLLRQLEEDGTTF